MPIPAVGWKSRVSDYPSRRLPTWCASVQCKPVAKALPGIVGQLREPHTCTAQCIRPGNVTGGLEIGRRLTQRKMQRQKSVRLDRRGRLHGHTFFAEVEDHASGYAVKAGKRRRI